MRFTVVLDPAPLLREHGTEVQDGLSIDRRWRPSLDAEEVMQVTYVEAYLRIGSLRDHSAPAFRRWLTRIAPNNLQDAIRALSRDKRPDGGGRLRATRNGLNSEETLLGKLADDAPSVSALVPADEAVARLRDALRRLPESYRKVVHGVDLEERPVAEVAEQMGRSAGSVDMLRSRAHDRLRELLGSSTRFF